MNSADSMLSKIFRILPCSVKIQYFFRFSGKCYARSDFIMMFGMTAYGKETLTAKPLEL